MVNVINDELDGAAIDKDQTVVVVFATNHREQLDPAIVSRVIVDEETRNPTDQLPRIIGRFCQIRPAELGFNELATDFSSEVLSAWVDRLSVNGIDGRSVRNVIDRAFRALSVEIAEKNIDASNKDMIRNLGRKAVEKEVFLHIKREFQARTSQSAGRLPSLGSFPPNGAKTS